MHGGLWIRRDHVPVWPLLESSWRLQWIKTPKGRLIGLFVNAAGELEARDTDQVELLRFSLPEASLARTRGLRRRETCREWGSTQESPVKSQPLRDRGC